LDRVSALDAVIDISLEFDFDCRRLDVRLSHMLRDAVTVSVSDPLVVRCSDRVRDVEPLVVSLLLCETSVVRVDDTVQLSVP